VVGAIFSGIAALLITMIVFRKIYHLENYLKEIHFKYLGTLLLVMSLIWFYFTFSEYLTAFFGHEPQEMRVIWYKFTGNFALPFWSMIIFNFIIPLIILSNKKTKTITGVLIASISVIIGMWLERLNIVIPSLANPRLPYPTGFYVPTLTEWSLFAGGLALFALGYLIFSKFFPLISVWEIKEGRKEGLEEVEKRIREYLPPDKVEVSS
jgi:molybdopterin-containing oxidoreductase family membrane subunit